MSDRLESGDCPTCQQQRLLRQPQPTHVLHLILTLVTFGLWGIAWLIIVARSQSAPARCTVCGTPLRKMFDPRRGTYWTA